MTRRARAAPERIALGEGVTMVRIRFVAYRRAPHGVAAEITEQATQDQAEAFAKTKFGWAWGFVRGEIKEGCNITELGTWPPRF